MHFVSQNYDFIKERLRLLYATQCDMSCCGVHDAGKLLCCYFANMHFFLLTAVISSNKVFLYFMRINVTRSVVVVLDRAQMALLKFEKYIACLITKL